jgi:hypothetical protein
VGFVKKLEFANYTLNFGERKVLLDLFDQVVMPSFFEMKYIRKLKGKGEYFFLDTKLIALDANPERPVLGISGRIVKNTKLKRDQIFRAGGGIIEDKSELETAPSSTFLLILNTHRLILCKEVPGAPTIQNLQSTSQNFLKKQHKKFIENEYESAKLLRDKDPSLDRVTKKSLVEEYPYPSLRITPLSDKESLKDFVGRLKHIDKVTIKLLPTNKEEIDNDDFWSDFGRRREEMNSKAAKVEFSNPKEGLDGDKVYEQAESASGMGNSEVSFKGYDGQGDTIRGSNEDFSLTVELDELSKNAESAAREKYDRFQNLVAENIINLPSLANDVMAKVIKIFNGL